MKYIDESTLRERVRKDLLVAESLQLMTLTHSAGTGCTEVRLHYTDPLNGRERFLVLGANWEEAETFLANPLYQGVRERFEGTLRQASVEKFEQLVAACFYNGTTPGPREARMIEHCRQKYAIPGEVAERVLVHLAREGNTAAGKVRTKSRIRPAWVQWLCTGALSLGLLGGWSLYIPDVPTDRVFPAISAPRFVRRATSKQTGLPAMQPISFDHPLVSPAPPPATPGIATDSCCSSGCSSLAHLPPPDSNHRLLQIRVVAAPPTPRHSCSREQDAQGSQWICQGR